MLLLLNLCLKMTILGENDFKPSMVMVIKICKISATVIVSRLKAVCRYYF